MRELHDGRWLRPPAGPRAAPSPRCPSASCCERWLGSSRSRAALARGHRGPGRRSQWIKRSRHAARPYAVWVLISRSSRSGRRLPSERALGSAAEPPAGRRPRRSLQDTPTSDVSMGPPGRYVELRASSRPPLPHPAFCVGCSARRALPWHRGSCVQLPPSSHRRPNRKRGKSHSLALVSEF